MAGISSIFVCILRSPLLLILLFLFFFLSRPRFINATYIINASTPIIDGKSLISAQGAFELGFFSPGTSPYRYLGIWFHHTPDKTVVWVANAKDPIRGSSGVLKISKRGLVLLDGDGNEVWNVAVESNNLSAELQDTGNFVLFEIVTSGSRRVLWQSFHHPSNTILPGMILERGQKLRAWKNISDPAGGEFSLELDSKADLDELIMKEGSKTYWKSGYWDPEIGMFSNLTEINPNNFFYFKLNTSSIDIHSVTYFSIYSNTRVVIDMTGQLKFFIWYEEGGRWVLVWTAPKDYCDTPVACGPNGVCSDLPCKCLMEFEPASPIDWKQGDYRGGCKRKTPLTCTKDMFMPLSIIQKPKNTVRWNLTGEGCKSECLDSCKCTAYSFGFATSTCDIWLQDLMGLGWDFMGESEVVENFHVRLAPSHAVTAGRQRRCPPCGSIDVPYPLSTGYGCGDPHFYGNIHCNNVTGELSFSTINGHSYTITNIYPKYRTLVIAAKSDIHCSGESNTQGKLDFDFSRPYFITNNTNIFMLNCSSQLTSTFWTCNSSSPCQTYASDISCFSSRVCCSNHKGSSEFWRSYSIISAKSCTSFATFIDIELPRDAWIPGVKIGWGKAHEQPLCAIQEDCHDWPNSTCSHTTQLGDEQRCICNENFHWDVQEQSCIEVSNAIGGIKASRELMRQKRRLHLVIIVNVVLAFSFIATALICFMRKMASRKRNADNTLIPLLRRNEEEDTDLPMVQFEVITAATGNFSHSNKLGQGGFGPVYKGQLPGGQEIAVKRLSQRSGQGVDEFKNELVLIAKLQHRNLVQLLGYCVEGDERILLYEYMPNRSLDFFLFDNNRCKSLDWKTRFNIIMGIAKGLLYLHQDSRLRIIHRDLKTSNILLDHEMNPKISDFGIARIFGGKEDEVNTDRVVGTYGYMSPEYASHGLFSTKSDVYSFGVILLEIITGQKNARFHKLEQQFNLLGHVWELWREGKGLQLVDPDNIEPSDQSEVLKCIHLGLLCIQDYPNDRPTMVSVLVMLMNDTTILPSPRKPAFLIRQSYSRAPSSSSDPNNLSINQVSQTMMDGR